MDHVVIFVVYCFVDQLTWRFIPKLSAWKINQPKPVFNTDKEEESKEDER